ncbi:MAG: M42 family peptidase, partial [Oscillospiraceae bacterium]
IEATTAGDLADVPDEKTVCKQGNGAVVSFMDNGTIYDKELYNNALNWAKYANLKCQAKQGVCGGNESRNLQTAGGGAKTLAVSLPTRYIHSGSSVLQVSDLTDTKDFLMMLTQKLFE